MAARLDRSFVVDTSLAAVFVAYAEVDVWLRRGVVPGQKAVAAVGLGLMTMSLAWRRRAPLLTCLVSGAALAVESIAAGGAPEGGVVLLPVLLLMFSVAAYEHRVRAIVGAALLLVAVLIQSVQDPKIVGTASLVLVDGFFFGILGVGSWALGRFVKRRREVEGTLSSKAATWQQLHEVEQVLIADERQQIARELHDVVAHTVSVMGVQAAAADQIMDGDPQRAREALSTIQDTARDAVNELRRLLTVLRAGESTPDLAPQPALRDLARLADLTRASGLDVDLTMPAPLPVLPLGIELAAYRIVQAATRNRHGMIRLLIVDDQDLVRSGFRMILDAQPDFEVVAEAADGAAALAEAKRYAPDVVLMDIRMPIVDGITATRDLLAEPSLSHTRVLILTTFDHDEYVYEGLRAGASGFLLKNAATHDLIAAVRTVHAGEALLAPSVTRRLIEQFVARPRLAGSERLSVLTARERDVLVLIARGRSNAEIAEALVVSGATVRTHVNRVLSKLSLRDRTQAAIMAYESGLVVAGET